MSNISFYTGLMCVLFAYILVDPIFICLAIVAFTVASVTE